MSPVATHDTENSVLSFLRFGGGEDVVACVANLTPIPRHGYRVGLPRPGGWAEILNTDAALYGGSGFGNAGSVMATGEARHGLPASAAVALPPLAVLWLAPA